MTRPVVSAVAERVYEALTPFTEQDEAYGWPLLTFVHVLTSAAAGVDDLAADSDTAPGWSALLDPDACPPQGLPFLGQLVGVPVPAGADATTARGLVKARGGWGRGTPAAVTAAAQLTLTGAKTVLLVERYTGSAYQVKVTTYTAETPDSAATQAAIQAALPAGLVLTYATLTGWTIDQFQTAYSGQTIADFQADYAGQTIADFERTLP